MAPIKICPPKKLPKYGVTDHLFTVWKEELEIYLAQDSRMAAFMKDGAYAKWEAYVENPKRILKPAGTDKKTQLPLRRSELCTFLIIVAKAGAVHHCDSIMHHSKSLQWIYSELQNNFKNTGNENENTFLKLLELQYQPGTSTIDFYNHYRNLVIANLRKKGDIIEWQNSRLMEVDEELSPTFEDLILVNVLGVIDKRLPILVRNNYYHLTGRTKRIMDYRTDILLHLPTMLIKTEENLPTDEGCLSRYQYAVFLLFGLPY